MTTLTIPNLDDDLAQRLRTRAAVHGRSVEAEAHSILADALGPADTTISPNNIADAIHAIMKPIGGIDLEPFPREPVPEPPRFD
jgi:plasmid stability protein